MQNLPKLDERSVQRRSTKDLNNVMSVTSKLMRY